MQQRARIREVLCDEEPDRMLIGARATAANTCRQLILGPQRHLDRRRAQMQAPAQVEAALLDWSGSDSGSPHARNSSDALEEMSQ
jgi:L-alanine-DL-glutamate epimerase-like enolase superfamily enzyme